MFFFGQVRFCWIRGTQRRGVGNAISEGFSMTTISAISISKLDRLIDVVVLAGRAADRICVGVYG